MENKVLVILGMHRSGTSLVAHWLSSCGLNLGDRLLSGNFSNINGHFEDLDFLELHENILDSLGKQNNGLIECSPLDVDYSYLEEMRSLVNKKQDLRQQWGWKEPRTCLLLKQYPELLPKAYYLVVYRSCKDVVNSLLRRDAINYLNSCGPVKKYNFLEKIRINNYAINMMKKINENNYIDAWKYYNSEILDHIEKHEERCLILNYLDLVDNDYKYINKIKSFGFCLNLSSFSEIYKKKYIKRNAIVIFPRNSTDVNDIHKRFMRHINRTKMEVGES